MRVERRLGVLPPKQCSDNSRSILVTGIRQSNRPNRAGAGARSSAPPLLDARGLEAETQVAQTACETGFENALGAARHALPDRPRAAGSARLTLAGVSQKMAVCRCRLPGRLGSLSGRDLRRIVSERMNRSRLRQTRAKSDQRPKVLDEITPASEFELLKRLNNYQSQLRDAGEADKVLHAALRLSLDFFHAPAGCVAIVHPGARPPRSCTPRQPTALGMPRSWPLFSVVTRWRFQES